MELNLCLISYAKVNSKWITDLKVRSETMKLLKENIRKNSITLTCTMDCLNMNTKVQAS
jgi:hypothetical protein